jgi:hypothetical protein
MINKIVNKSSNNGQRIYKIIFDISSVKDSLVSIKEIFSNLLQTFVNEKKAVPFTFFSTSVFKLIRHSEFRKSYTEQKAFPRKKTHTFYIAPPFYFSAVASFTTASLLVAAVQFFHKEGIFSSFKLNFIFFLLATFF